MKYYSINTGCFAIINPVDSFADIHGLVKDDILVQWLNSWDIPIQTVITPRRLTIKENTSSLSYSAQIVWSVPDDIALLLDLKFNPLPNPAGQGYVWYLGNIIGDN